MPKRIELTNKEKASRYDAIVGKHHDTKPDRLILWIAEMERLRNIPADDRRKFREFLEAILRGEIDI